MSQKIKLGKTIASNFIYDRHYLHFLRFIKENKDIDFDKLTEISDEKVDELLSEFQGFISMIDMRGYFTHKDYQNTVSDFNTKFNNNRCDAYWSIFTNIQKEISNNKCPICEVELTDIPNKTNTATLDHFRLKDANMYQV